MSRVAIADKAHDLADRQIALAQQLCRGGHTPRHQFFMEGVLAELRIGALKRSRGAAQHSRDRGQCEVAAAMLAGHDHPCQQVKAVSLAECVGTHIPLSRRRERSGKAGVQMCIRMRCAGVP